jgi:hypothetical protein
VAVNPADGKASRYRCTADGPLETLATATSSVTWTANNWYTLKAVVEENTGGFPVTQRLRFYVDSGGGFGSAMLDTGLIDDDWPAGYTGLFTQVLAGTTQEFDDFKAGYAGAMPGS